MTGKIFQPQMTQIGADKEFQKTICAHLRHLRLNMVLKEILGKIEG